MYKRINSRNSKVSMFELLYLMMCGQLPLKLISVYWAQNRELDQHFFDQSLRHDSDCRKCWNIHEFLSLLRCSATWMRVESCHSDVNCNWEMVQNKFERATAVSVSFSSRQVFLKDFRLNLGLLVMQARATVLGVFPWYLATTAACLIHTPKKIEIQWRYY